MAGSGNALIQSSIGFLGVYSVSGVMPLWRTTVVENIALRQFRVAMSFQFAIWE
jgi:hypothetical protein